MSVYATEEEQIEAIKRWWHKHSNKITLAISIVFLVIAGVRYWGWHKEKVAFEASGAYEVMVNAYANNKREDTLARANQIINEFSNTSYADAARLLLAKQMVDSSQFAKARTHLETVSHRGRMPALRSIATARLARLYIVDKQYEKALSELSRLKDETYVSLVNELKGDVYSAKGNAQRAMHWYGLALKDFKQEKLGNPYLEMKKNELAALTSKAAAGSHSNTTV